jgi:serine protease Do
MALPISGRVAETLRKSTVQVRGENSRFHGSGSGIVISPDRIITNAHVIQTRDSVIECWEGKLVKASLIKEDRQRDLALLSAPGLNGAPAILGDSDFLRPGTPVIAIGNPLGFVGALSTGTVQRTVRLNMAFGDSARQNWICSNVRLAPGNSGGPLANLQGEIVGINTMVAARGLAFSIPSRTVQTFLARDTGSMSLGVVVRPVGLKTGATGFVILKLVSGGAAESASLLIGDTLVAADGNSFRSQDDLFAAIEQCVDSILELTFFRQSRALRRVHVKLLPTHLQHAA